MSRSRDQDAIDSLAAWITADDAPAANGNGAHHLAAVPDKSDQEIIEKARAEKGGKFDRLWNGDLSGCGGDHSSADDALVHKLYSYTQDENQIRRIHSASGLHRPDKSGKRHEYLRYSLERARKNTTWFYEWDAPSISITHGQKIASSSSPSPSSNDDDDDVALPKAVPFCEMGEPKEHRDVLAGLVPESYPTVFYGDGGSAKSMLALSLGVAVAGDARTWLGRWVSKAPVLYCDFELDAEEQNRRVRRIVSGAGLERPPAGLYYLAGLGYSPTTALAAAYEECQERGVKLMILDSFGPAFAGDSEAARDIIGFFGRIMEPFRALGVAVLLIDHQARQQAGESYQKKSAFGSVYKTNLARSVVQVEASDRGDDYLDLRLRQKKHNFGRTAEPFGARVTFGDKVTITHESLDDADLASEGTLNSTDQVKAALRAGPAYPDELAERTGLERGNVSNCITKLKKSGVVETTGERQGRSEQVQLASSSSQLLGADDDDDANPRPASDNLQPGESATVGELNARKARALLTNPPEWFAEQVRRARREPSRYRKSVANAIASHLNLDVAEIQTEVERELWR